MITPDEGVEEGQEPASPQNATDDTGKVYPQSGISLVPSCIAIHWSRQFLVLTTSHTTAAEAMQGVEITKATFSFHSLLSTRSVMLHFP